MGVTFEQPVWLWAALVGLPLVAVGLRWFMGMGLWRRVSAVGARALLTALIAAMLAGAQSVRETDRLAVVAVVDVSGSVRRFADFGPGIGDASDPVGFARAWLDEATDGRGADDLLGLVLFDGRAVTIATPGRGRVFDRSTDLLPIDGSDLAGAMRHAAALIPADAAGRIVLISDGNATGADPAVAAAELASAVGPGGTAVPVDVLPVTYRVDEEVIVERLDAPPRAAGGATVPLRVEIRTTAGTTGTLRLAREGRPVDISAGENTPGGGRRLSLGPGRHVVVLDVPLEDGRLSRFDVVFEPDIGPNGQPVGDRSLDNNGAQAFTISPGESRVLLVDGVDQGKAGGPGTVLARTLRRAGLDVEVVAPGGMPTDLLAMQAHDLVILQNVAAEEIPGGSMPALVAFVRELGGGLVVVGGPKTLGAGGWRGSELEPILPVKLDLPEKLVVPEAAIVLVLDSSGSMLRSVLGSSRTQQAVANESAARAVMSLDDKDLVGVIAFSNEPRVVVPLGPATDREGIAERTRSISSGGGTNLGPAMREAASQLNEIEAKHKHVIVLSDGQSQNAEGLPAIAASMRAQGIRLSSIAVGDEADLGTLETVANEGEGAFYHVLNPNVLPSVFLKAVRVMRSPLVREQPFEVALLDTGSPLTAGLTESQGTPPRLGGLVLTQAREEPTITYAMAAPTGEPVLAHWPVELGQVAVFTSDAHDWARDWLGWSGYEALWSRTARLLSRSTGGETGEMRVRRGEDGRVRILYEALDDSGRPIDLLDVPAVVYGPGGEPRRIRLRQTGPGQYTGEAPARTGGNYLVIAKPRLGGVSLPPVLSGTTVAGGAEYARLTSDMRTLERIAEAGGGRVLDAGDARGVDLFDRATIEPRESRTPLWPVLLAWTLAVFLLDVGTRRIAWDRLLPDRAAEAELRRIAGFAGQSVSALRDRRVAKPGGGATAAVGERAQALSDADADKLRREAKRRRYEAYQEEIRRKRGESEAPKDQEQSKPKDTDTAGEPTGLMAAKMRARKRFESDGEAE